MKNSVFLRLKKIKKFKFLCNGFFSTVKKLNFNFEPMGLKLFMNIKPLNFLCAIQYYSDTKNTG